MGQTQKPACFVAMVFGHQDRDEFYEKQILPVLQRNNAKPIIVNRYKCNDDLNLQIPEQIRASDFCIADST
jgi:hypothetical protein